MSKKEVVLQIAFLTKFKKLEKHSVVVDQGCLYIDGSLVINDSGDICQGGKPTGVRLDQIKPYVYEDKRDRFLKHNISVLRSELKERLLA